MGCFGGGAKTGGLLSPSSARLSPTQKGKSREAERPGRAGEEPGADPAVPSQGELLTKPIHHLRPAILPAHPLGSSPPPPSHPSCPASAGPSASVLLHGAPTQWQLPSFPVLELGPLRPRRTPTAHPWASLHPARVLRNALEAAGQLGRAAVLRPPAQLSPARCQPAWGLARFGSSGNQNGNPGWAARVTGGRRAYSNA